MVYGHHELIDAGLHFVSTVQRGTVTRLPDVHDDLDVELPSAGATARVSAKDARRKPEMSYKVALTWSLTSTTVSLPDLETICTFIFHELSDLLALQRLLKRVSTDYADKSAIIPCSCRGPLDDTKRDLWVDSPPCACMLVCHK